MEAAWDLQDLPYQVEIENQSSSPNAAGAGSFKQGMLGKDEMKANHAKKLPYRFSWLEQGQLAGTSVPSTVAQLEGLVREGVSSGSRYSLII